jgi:hypothetical protein
MVAVSTIVYTSAILNGTIEAVGYQGCHSSTDNRDRPKQTSI